MNRFSHLFDLRAGLIACIVMGSIVAWINSGHGSQAALTSGLKQAAYTFIVSGFMAQLCRQVTTYFTNPAVALLAATSFPTALTVVMVFIVHSTRGTPEPFYSTIPVAVLSLFWFSKLAREALSEEDCEDQPNEGGS